MNGPVFLAYVEQSLAPTLKRGDIVTMDNLPVHKVAGVQEAIEAVGVVLDGFVEPFVYDRDPDDAHYVNLALAADATLIVTRDADLLDLMNASQNDGKEFQTRFPTLKIITPPAFLAVVRRTEPQS